MVRDRWFCELSNLCGYIRVLRAYTLTVRMYGACSDATAILLGNAQVGYEYLLDHVQIL